MFEIKCFDYLLTGIKDFAKSTGSSAKNVPSDIEAARIKKKIDEAQLRKSIETLLPLLKDSNALIENFYETTPDLQEKLYDEFRQRLKDIWLKDN